MPRVTIGFATIIAPGHRMAHAMDCYRNLYCRDVEGGFIADRDTGGKPFFNHSSFNAGKSVICAGVLVIEGGSLKKINNMSGHYRPTKDNLIECIKVLKGDLVDLNERTATYFDPRTKADLEININDV